MLTLRSVYLVAKTISLGLIAFTLFCQPPAEAQRNPILMDVLARTIAAAGGTEALAAVHDITESGQITLNEDKDINGPVSIRLLGGTHFKMEASLPDGKRAWIVKDGTGVIRQSDGMTISLSGQNSINLGNLTFPVAHIPAVIAEDNAKVSLVRVETQDGKSVYRIRLKGNLGLVPDKKLRDLVSKDLIIDALTFDILAIEDNPIPTFQNDGKISDVPLRKVVYSDFHLVNQVRVPFLITAKLHDQALFTIRLNSVQFNSHLLSQDFVVGDSR